MGEKNFHTELKDTMDAYVHFVYVITKTFPREELYGVTSQLRRSALSVVLNYIEGYARSSKKSNKHFLDMSYASLKESMYLLEFSFKENYLDKENYEAPRLYSRGIFHFFGAESAEAYNPPSLKLRRVRPAFIRGLTPAVFCGGG